MVTFECSEKGVEFETDRVLVTDKNGQIILKTRDGCPHCDAYSHSKRGSVEELEALR